MGLRSSVIHTAGYSCSWPAEHREQLVSEDAAELLPAKSCKQGQGACMKRGPTLEVKAFSLPALQMLPHLLALHGILRDVVHPSVAPKEVLVYKEGERAFPDGATHTYW